MKHRTLQNIEFMDKRDNWNFTQGCLKCPCLSISHGFYFLPKSVNKKNCNILQNSQDIFKMWLIAKTCDLLTFTYMLFSYLRHFTEKLMVYLNFYSLLNNSFLTHNISNIIYKKIVKAELQWE